jgi:hypothetical protein
MGPLILPNLTIPKDWATVLCYNKWFCSFVLFFYYGNIIEYKKNNETEAIIELKEIKPRCSVTALLST